MLAIAAILVVGLIVATSFQVPTTGMLTGGGAMVLLLLSLNRFFLPSAFAIDASGITAAWPMKRQRVDWSDVKRFAHDDQGGFLATATRTSRWHAPRGMHVLLGLRQQAVLDRIKLMLPMEAQA